MSGPVASAASAPISPRAWAALRRMASTLLFVALTRTGTAGFPTRPRAAAAWGRTSGSARRAASAGAASAAPASHQAQRLRGTLPHPRLLASQRLDQGWHSGLANLPPELLRGVPADLTVLAPEGLDEALDGSLRPLADLRDRGE